MLTLFQFSKVGIVQECLDEMGLGDKRIGDLSPEQLYELKGKLEEKYVSCLTIW